MTKDDIIKIVCELANAINAIAAAEREACAKLCDEEVWSYDYREIAAAIRARGEK